jgi:hypothetical protein
MARRKFVAIAYAYHIPPAKEREGRWEVRNILTGKIIAKAQGFPQARLAEIAYSELMKDKGNEQLARRVAKAIAHCVLPDDDVPQLKE